MGGPEEVADTVVEKVDGGDTENRGGPPATASYGERRRLWEVEQGKKPIIEKGVSGKVKWYSARHHHGFIACDDGVFVHQTAISKSPMIKYYLLALWSKEKRSISTLWDENKGRGPPTSLVQMEPRCFSLVHVRFVGVRFVLRLTYVHQREVRGNPLACLILLRRLVAMERSRGWVPVVLAFWRQVEEKGERAAAKQEGERQAEKEDGTEGESGEEGEMREEDKAERNEKAVVAIQASKLTTDCA
ncbi:unnamed protein product [Toxocara canis]|uniref:CSD domain-containing protein n=1 Tax=Toxocara canis TaxID=6265 RepID=A0A183VBD1_TOXCA|nr:unnamed protein product [Toxocara canis]